MNCKRLRTAGADVLPGPAQGRAIGANPIWARRDGGRLVARPGIWWLEGNCRYRKCSASIMMKSCRHSYDTR